MGPLQFAFFQIQYVNDTADRNALVETLCNGSVTVAFFIYKSVNVAVDGNINYHRILRMTT